MKKILWSALLLILICSLVLSACDVGSDTPDGSQGPHTHSFDEWNVTKPATCTEDGTRERVCACGEKETQTISAHGHTEVIDSAVDSTCKVNGKTEGKHCSVCNTVIVAQASLPLKDHTYDNDDDAECNACGSIRVINCKHTRTEVLPAVESTCSASGLTEGKKCSDCGKILVEQLATTPKEHTADVVYGYDSTCTRTGLTDSQRCSICDTELEKAVTIPVKPHEYDDQFDESCNQCDFIRDLTCTHTATSVIPGKNATCTEAGLTDGSKCTECGEMLTAQTAIPKLGHAEVIDAAVAATCTTDGKTEGKHCSRCGETLIAQIAIPKLGHAEVIDAAVSATCTEGGKTEGKHCSRCEEVLIAQTATPKLGHAEVTDAAVGATCTADGKTEGKHCSRCEEVLIAQTTIPSPGHSISNGKCSTCGEDFNETQSKVVDLIMFMGQSNMAGRGVASQAPTVPEGHGYEFRAMSDPTKLYSITEPFGVNENNKASGVTESMKTGSMVSAFVNAYYAERNVPVVAVSCSKGGTGIGNFWYVGGPALNDAIDRHNRAKAWLETNGYTIGKDFMVWCQGETDGGNGVSGATYKEQLTDLIEEMIDKAGIEFCAVVRIGNHRDNATVYDEIIRAQTELCKEYSKAVLVSTKLAGFAAEGKMKDPYHFKQPAYNEAGEDAGKNTAYYIRTGSEPTMSDPEYGNTYPTDPLPEPESPGSGPIATELEFLFNSTSENGIDLSEIGTVKDGAITITSSSNKNNGIELSEAIEISPDQSFTIEFICDYANSTGASAGIILGSGSSTGGFLFLSSSSSNLRLRNTDNSVQLDGITDPAGTPTKTHFAVVYDAKEETITMYQDYEVISVEKTRGSFEDFGTVTFTTLFGGYKSDNKFEGTMHYFKYVDRALEAIEFNQEAN